MKADDLTARICTTCTGVHVLENSGDLFFLYDPDRDLPPERQRPFATLVTGDHYDTFSDLGRPDAYRLNIGLTKATYAAMSWPDPVDHAARDVLMPHPEYAAQHWVCVVNPGPATLDTVWELLTEAHGFAVRKYDRYRSRSRTTGA